MAYDMLSWMLMSPSLRASNHFAGTKLDGVTPANHLYTQLGTGLFYWIKGDSGYPWDINIFDNTYIYLSTTENSWTDPHTGKRFESLTPSIGYKGVPFAKRLMNIGDAVFSSDTRFGIYTACGTATYSNLGTVKCTLTGPYVETIPGAGSTLPSNLTTIHLEYEWSLDGSYHHQAGSTKETYTLCQPYGLVRWQSQPWNTGTLSYDPPTDATNYNILTPGVTGIPFVDPCPFGINGGGSLTLTRVSGQIVLPDAPAGATLLDASRISTPWVAWLKQVSNQFPMFLVDTTNGAQSIALPTGSVYLDQERLYVKTSADANTVTLTGAQGGDVVLTTQLQKQRFRYDGTNWWPV